MLVVPLVLPLLLIVVPIKLLTKPFERPKKRSASNVLFYLTEFRDGMDGGDGWDYFISVPIADPLLEDIRQRAAVLGSPADDDDLVILNELIAEVETLETEDRQPSPAQAGEG